MPPGSESSGIIAYGRSASLGRVFASQSKRTPQAPRFDLSSAINDAAFAATITATGGEDAATAAVTTPASASAETKSLRVRPNFTCTNGPLRIPCQISFGSNQSNLAIDFSNKVAN